MRKLVPFLFVLSGLFPALAAAGPEITVYKSPTCGCCNAWIKHLERNGFDVSPRNVDIDPIKEHFGVPKKMRACHTAVVDGYLIEGHVPASDIKRLLKERPAVKGLAVPGMPMGSPGMEGPYRLPYKVMSFDKDGGAHFFSQH